MLLAGIWLSGCESAAPMPLERPLQVTGAYDSVWRQAQKALIDRDFRIDRSDKQAGLLETWGLTSKQWFEFWRRDLVGGDAVVESSLQPTRRRVRIEMLPGDMGVWQVDCRVSVERLAADPQRSGRLVRAWDIYGGSKRRLPTLGLKEGAAEIWEVVGRDQTLEAAILCGIGQRMAQQI